MDEKLQLRDSIYNEWMQYESPPQQNTLELCWNGFIVIPLFGWMVLTVNLWLNWTCVSSFGHVALACSCLVLAVGNYLVSRREKVMRHRSLSSRVSSVLNHLSYDCICPQRSSQSPSLPCTGLHSVTAFRGGVWRTVPSNLLIKGDFIAQTSLDSPPGLVEEVDMREALAGHHEGASTGATFPLSSPSVTAVSNRIPIEVGGHWSFPPPTSGSLLNLSEQLRVYRMLETPVLEDIRAALHSEPPPPTPTTVMLDTLIRLGSGGAAVLLLLAVLVEVVLYLFSPPESQLPTLHTLIIITLPFLPLTAPPLLLLLECAAAACLLSDADRAAVANHQVHVSG